MVSKAEVLKLLPPYNNQVKVVNWRQSTAVIKKEIVKAHGEYETEYDAIYPLFDTGDIYTTCRELWDFCKYNLKYSAESNEDQSVKSPTTILQAGEKVDCKHYSLFIGGVLDAIQKNEGADWVWSFRFVSDKADGIIGHVFVVVKTDGGEIEVDPCEYAFNVHANWTNIEDVDFVPAENMQIAGIGQTSQNNFFKYAFWGLVAYLIID